MADPVTIAIIGSAVLGGVSSIQQSKAGEQQLRAQQQAAEFNQRISEQNAEIVRGQTEAELERADRERRLRIGANIASAGALGGIRGSSLDILQDNITQEELSILTIQQEGLLRERSVLLGGQLQGLEARAAGAQIGPTRFAGGLGAASSILSGTSRVLDR